MSDLQTATLDGIALLAPLSAQARRDLARQCRWKRYRPQSVVVDRASDHGDVCFVVEGRVRVLIHSASGREISFDEVPAGGHLGELSAIDGRPRSASIVALSDCLIAFLPAAAFAALLESNPPVAMAVMRRMADMLRNATARIVDLSTLGANNRVHAELLRLARRAGVAGKVAAIRPIPPHGDIASRVSTTRETVARVLGDLARSGIVERRADALVVTDVPRLETMVEDVGEG